MVPLISISLILAAMVVATVVYLEDFAMTFRVFIILAIGIAATSELGSLLAPTQECGGLVFIGRQVVEEYAARLVP
jgi:hypothetical protein